MKLIDLTGSRFGKLVALRLGVPHQSPSRRQVTWECICDCGNIITVQRGSLTFGNTSSCGCAYKDAGIRRKTNRIDHLSEYSSWSKMKQRCTNPRDKDFKYYGARGISICNEWENSFQKFFEDMGKKPSNAHSIDRIDCNGNYEKQNCRWATPLEQSRNRRHTKYFSKQTGIHHGT